MMCDIGCCCSHTFHCLSDPISFDVCALWLCPVWKQFSKDYWHQRRWKQGSKSDCGIVYQWGVHHHSTVANGDWQKANVILTIKCNKTYEKYHRVYQTTNNQIHNINTTIMMPKKDKNHTCGLAVFGDIPNFQLSRWQWFHPHCSWIVDFYQKIAIQSQSLQQ